MNARARITSRPLLLAVIVTLASAGLALAYGPGRAAASPAVAVLDANPARPDVNLIKHVVFIVQENRSFDEYFGMYPGADGIPVDRQGKPTVCVPDPLTKKCDRPFHDPADTNVGGPHGIDAFTADVDGGKMDGFVAQYEDACLQEHGRACRRNGANAQVPASEGDVMGYKLRADIPNYWAYADHFVLEDHNFEPLGSWSEPSHLALVSGWSALCSQPGVPLSCVNEPDNVVHAPNGGHADYAWTSLTYLLDRARVSWAYYVFKGGEPDCNDPDAIDCVPAPMSAKTPSIWNPLPGFDDVRSDGTQKNVQSISNLVGAARAGSLPAVSWVIPNRSVSEHAPASVSAGERYVTYLVNQLMKSPDWDSTAIFLTWDDWGGFYDHVKPTVIDQNGLGIRTPALIISPYAERGYIDHQTVSSDSYLRLIEDRFLGGARIDPSTDGRPDNRPDVRENAPQLGNLLDDFDFTQAPRAPLLLPTVAPSKLASPLPQPAANASFPAGAAAPVDGRAPYTIDFDGSHSRDPNGIASWTLDFGDGTPVASGQGSPPPKIAHTYARAGAFTPTLTIRDSDGNAASATQPVSIGPAAGAPSAWVTATPIVGYAPQTEVIDGAQSASGAWTIDFGDGSPVASGKGVPPATLPHTYDAPGDYTQTLTVVAGGTRTTAQSRITILRASAPVARTTGVSASEPSWATLTGHVTPNDDGTTVWFAWGRSPRRLNERTPREAAPRIDDISARIDHLARGTTYWFQLVAKNAQGTSRGRVVRFTTKP